MGFLNGHFTTGISGGSEFDSQNFTGTTITSTASGLQKHRYTGVSAQTLTAIDSTLAIDGALLNILCLDDTNTLTMDNNDVSNGWLLNGQFVGVKGSYITLQRDSALSRWVEVSRNA